MVLVFDRVSSSAFILMFVGAFIRTKDNHTFSCMFIWVGNLGVWVFRVTEIRMFVPTLSQQVDSSSACVRV